MKRIRKNYSGAVPNGKVLNTKNNSLEDTYSCDYLNDNIPVTNNMGNIIVDDIKCKNLLPNHANSTTKNGVTITVNKDKSITFNGTATSTFNYFIFNNYHFKLKAGTYNLSFHKKGTISGTALVTFYNQEDIASLVSNINLASYSNVVENTATDLDLKDFLVYIVTGCVFNNFTIYPQLEEGLETSDYVEHKDYGIQSSSDYIKYEDGTLICHGKFTVSNLSFSAWGGCYSTDIKPNMEFPIKFVENPDINVTNCDSNLAVFIARAVATSEKISVIALSRGTNTTITTCQLQYIAIGRWK